MREVSRGRKCVALSREAQTPEPSSSGGEAEVEIGARGRGEPGGEEAPGGLAFLFLGGADLTDISHNAWSSALCRERDKRNEQTTTRRPRPSGGTLPALGDAEWAVAAAVGRLSEVGDRRRCRSHQSEEARPAIRTS